MKKQILILLFIFLPTLLKATLLSFAQKDIYINNVSIENYREFSYIMGNLTPFILGLFLIVKPVFFVNLSRDISFNKFDLSEGVPRSSFLLLRLIGSVMFSASLISTYTICHDGFL